MNAKTITSEMTKCCGMWGGGGLIFTFLFVAKFGHIKQPGVGTPGSCLSRSMHREYSIFDNKKEIGDITTGLEGFVNILLSFFQFS